MGKRAGKWEVGSGKWEGLVRRTTCGEEGVLGGELVGWGRLLVGWRECGASRSRACSENDLYGVCLFGERASRTPCAL